MGLVVVPALFITALIFFTLIGAALIYPKSWWGKLLAVCIVLSPLVWLTWDIPVGYVRYKKACEEESGFKVYVNDLVPAKRVRLVESADYPEFIFSNYDTIQQVEAKDEKFLYIRPSVYALFEKRDDGKIVSTLMDTLIETRNGMRFSDSAPSMADYFIEKIDRRFSYRLSKTSYQMYDKNRRLVAEFIIFGYTTSNTDTSIFWNGYGCGSPGLNNYEIKALLSLIAVEKNKS